MNAGSQPNPNSPCLQGNQFKLLALKPAISRDSMGCQGLELMAHRVSDGAFRYGNKSCFMEAINFLRGALRICDAQAAGSS